MQISLADFTRLQYLLATYMHEFCETISVVVKTSTGKFSIILGEARRLQIKSEGWKAVLLRGDQGG